MSGSTAPVLMPTPDPADETLEVEHASGGGFWHWVGRVVPTTIVVAGLIGLAVWGHENDWTIPKFSELFGGKTMEVVDWCEEHNVPESQCVECNKSLLPAGTDHGWCSAHGVMQCPLENPDIVQLKTQPTITPAMLGPGAAEKQWQEKVKQLQKKP